MYRIQPIPNPFGLPAVMIAVGDARLVEVLPAMPAVSAIPAVPAVEYQPAQPPSQEHPDGTLEIPAQPAVPEVPAVPAHPPVTTIQAVLTFYSEAGTVLSSNPARLTPEQFAAWDSAVADDFAYFATCFATQRGFTLL